MFDEVFQFVLKIAVDKKLLAGKTVGVDSTTLEANAAMKSIVRRDTGEDWKQYVTRLMREDGTIPSRTVEPTDEEVRRYDKKRKNKRVSNEEWVSQSDPESRITQMKDGRTHLAYKAEHVVDLKSDIVLAAEIRKADEADTETLVDSVMEAQNNLNQAGSQTEIEEVAADKGYHAASHAGIIRSRGIEDLHSRAASQAPSPLDRQAGGISTRRVRQPTTHQAGQEQTLAAPQKRIVRTDLCPRVRPRRNAAELAERCRESDEALPDCSRRAQFGRILWKLLGVGKPKSLQGEGGLAVLVHLIASILLAWRVSSRCRDLHRAAPLRPVAV